MQGINILLRSDYWGQGKTVTALSYRTPDGKQPKRLVIDTECRDAPYKAPNSKDKPAKLLFAFDFFENTYGPLSADSLIALYTDIVTRKFAHDVLIVDNVAIFQDELYIMLAQKADALKVARALSGVYERNRLFLDTRFSSTNSSDFYPFLKNVLKALLLACRRSGITVIATTESKNVWKNYGSRDPKKKPKIMGQTARALDPWFQFSDVLLVLSRIEGDRDSGNAKLKPWPTATLDTFNVKCSLPGVAPKFEFPNWEVFWQMIEKRDVPDAAKFAEVEIPAAEVSEDGTPGPETIEEAKRAIAGLAVTAGIMASLSDKDGAEKLKELGAGKGLSLDNALAEYQQWQELISSAAEKDGVEEA